MLHTPRTAVLAILVVASLALAGSMQAAASDLGAAANIHMYQKPFKVDELVLRNSAGQTVSLSSFRGRVVLLHFWSIQCPACRMEEPMLAQLRRSFGPADLEILGVNLVDTPDAIAKHAGAAGMPFSVLFDGGRGFKLEVVNMSGRNTAFLVNPSKEAILEVPGFPTTYILDCRGSAVAYSVGAARWDTSYAQTFLRNLVQASKTCASEQSGGNLSRYSMR